MAALTPIRLRDHVAAEELEQLPPDLRALAEAAEWTLDFAVVMGRATGQAHVDCSLTPNYAAVELQRRASRMTAGITE